MNAVGRFIRKWWWVFLIAAVTVAFVVWRILRPTSNPTDPLVPPKFLDRAHDEVERIHLEGEVEKARVRATADAQRAELDRIEEQGKEDPQAAREALSGWLNANL